MTKRRSVWVVEYRCAKDEPWMRSNVVPRAHLTRSYAVGAMKGASPSEEKFQRVVRYDASK